MLVETVGVGQSETMVAEMTDVFVLLIAPGGGDELQGVKRGIMEMADLVLVNKADGEHLPQAGRTRADYAGALRLMRPHPGDPPGWPRVLAVSALTGAGLTDAWAAVEALAAARQASGAWEDRRRRAGGRRLPPAGRAGADRRSSARRGAAAAGTSSPPRSPRAGSRPTRPPTRCWRR